MTRRFKTGTVARRLGMTPPLLRIWESRYSLVKPERGPGGQRLYSEDDITMLEAVRALVEGGHPIGELATWSAADVKRAAATKSKAAHRASTPLPARGRPRSTLPHSDITPDPGASVAITLERDGRVAIVSPSVEAVLGWPHGLLVGQPIWGILLDPPAQLVDVIAGRAVGEKKSVLWVWMRSRSGAPIPCRLAFGLARRHREGAAVTLMISPLTAHGEDALSHALTTLGRQLVGVLPPSRENALKGWADRAIRDHGAVFARAWTYREGDNTLRLVASSGLSRSVRTSSRAVIKIATYPYKVGAVARTGIPFLHNGLQDDRDFDQGWVKNQKLMSAAVLPLTSAGKLLGVTVEFFRRRLTSEDIGRVQAAAALTGVTLERLLSGPS